MEEKRVQAHKYNWPRERQAVAAGVPMGVVLADAGGYGDETAFRDGITELDTLYAVGIRPATTVWAPGTAPARTLPAAPVSEKSADGNRKSF